MFDQFWGNAQVVAALDRMIGNGRIAQTLLFAGSEGVGKATLARRFASRLLGHADRIELDDLSRAENLDYVAEREKWPADKRNEDPLLFASHPDFVTFAPDGPLRHISIPQMRLLKERAPFKPLHGSRRVSLIDHVDRAGEEAANSLLKTLEEPPEHLILILTAENSYDLLPTIRSRAVPFHLAPLSTEEMRRFVESRRLDHPDRRVALSAGSPGRAASLDLEIYDKRRTAMFALLQAAADSAPFHVWMRHSEAISRSKSEKLDLYLKVLYGLLRDLMLLREGGGELSNFDLRPQLEPLAQRVTLHWIRTAVRRVDELAELLRRNIQKTIALDALILELKACSRI